MDSTISAFGVEHGGVSKRDSQVSAGRVATGTVAPGYHAIVAGKKGKKLRAAGHELGGAIGGTAIGTIVGGPAVGGLAGYAGAGAGTHMAARKGYYKKLKPKLSDKPVPTKVSS